MDDTQTRPAASEAAATAGTFRLVREADGIGRIIVDRPGEKVNVLSRGVFEELATLLDTIERDSSLRAVVFVSAKPDFVAGADLTEIVRATDAAQATGIARWAQGIFGRLDGLRVPAVAAIHGACLGGGMEMALACRYRIATDHERTQLGQPEVKLGILPAAGGTQRLPRLVGLTRALDLVLSGRTLTAREALRAGLVDEVVEESILVRAALESADGLARGRIPPRPPGGGRRPGLAGLLSLEGLRHMALEANPLGRRLMFSRALARVEEQAGEHYPAPSRALEALRIGIEEGPPEGYAAEARAFGDLVTSRTAKSLISIFFGTTEAKKASADLGCPDRPRPVELLGVLGAGLMGSGIAEVATARGIEVRMKDVSLQDLGRGMAAIHRAAQGRVERRRMNPRQMRGMLDRVSVTTAYSGFRAAEVIVEAVPEVLDLKRQVLSEVEAHVRPDAIFASNTSALPIARIAEATSRPGQVIGMHFFSPVARMPLVEIIATDRTERWVVETIRTLALRMGKTPIVVRDAPGFYTTRVLGIFLLEAVRMLEEGGDIAGIDAAVKALGFPVGPFRLADEVGLDVAGHVARTLSEAFPERVVLPAIMDRLAAQGRKGKRTGKGFYLYEGRDRRPDPQIDARSGVSPGAWPAIQRRLLLVFVAEAIRCLEEGILARPVDGDLGAVMGVGFPPHLGGPFKHADDIGAGPLVEQLLGLEKRHGPLYAPPQRLAEMARDGRRFYGEGARSPS